MSLSYINLFFVFFFVAAHAATNCVTVSQSKTDSYTISRKKYTQWQVTLTAKSSVNDVSAVTMSFSPSLFNYTSLTKQGSVYSINSGIQAHGTYTFNYVVQSTDSTTITIKSCGTTSATSTPTPQSTPIPTPKATPAPTSLPLHNSRPQIVMDSTTATHCDVAFVFDNYIMRNTNLSNADLIAKYTDYFADIQTYYRLNFNMDLRISHIYLESNSSFSDTVNDGELLDSFRSAIIGGFFPGLPTSACIYHLLTGRDIDGIGGLTWVGTACGSNLFNLGFTVDVAAREDAVSVIRRMTHEIGHSFGGNHWDYYSSNPLYTCDAAVGDNAHRILRNGAYKFVSNDLYMTQCATSSILSTLPNFQCMWDENTTPFDGSVTVYTDRDFQGDSSIIPARFGLQKCYNIAYPFAGTVMGFKAQGQAVTGIRFFANSDCVGDMFSFGTSSAYVGDAIANAPLSFMYLV